MSGAVQSELFFFLVCVSAGVIIAFGYDLLRALRRVFRHGNLLLAVEDFLYWSLAGVFAFVVFFLKNNGAVRGFSLCAMMLGMAAYYISASRFIVKSVFVILRHFSTTASKIVGYLLRPFAFFAKKNKKALKKNT